MARSLWIETAVGIVLGRVTSADGRRGFGAVDEQGRFANELAALGFSPGEGVDAGGLTGGLWSNFTSPPTPRRTADVLGRDRIQVVELDDDEIARRFDAAKARVLSGIAQQRLSAAVPLGMNYAGCPVYETATGRAFTIKRGDKEVVVFEHGVGEDGRQRRESMPGAFLFADTPAALRQVTDGAAIRVLQGARLNGKDFNALVDIATRHHVSESSAYLPTRHDFQESLEASLHDAFARQAGRSDDAERLYKIAMRLYDGMPVQNERTASSVANQQFSTPLPISFVGQRLLGDTSGLTVLEPTIGNRSLVAALPRGSKVYGLEIDPRRAKQFGENVGAHESATVYVGDATTADFKALFAQPDGFDCTIANPPFGSLDRVIKVRVDSPLVRDLETKRLDHHILLRTLAARKPEGRSVFIIGADHAIDDGAVEGRTRFLLNFLADHYRLEGAVDLDGKLYRKMGASYPVRMLVVGERRAEPSHDADAPTHLPVLRSHAEVLAWAEGLLNARRDLQQVNGRERPSAIEADASMQARQPRDASAQSVTDAVAADGGSVEAAMQAQLDAVDAGAVGDDFQMGYAPFSNVGDGTTMIPVNLAAPVYHALTEIERRKGDIDTFVARELDYPQDDLHRLFSPEQVDAIALAISAKQNARGFLLADQMGVGKGRVLAAMARHARLNGEVPAFVTVKPNLFSDFLERDLVDIGSRHLFKQPFIFNAETKIVDRAGTVTHRSMKPAEYSRTFKEGALPAGTDIVFLTYSQLARPEERSARAKFFQDIANGGLSPLLDESHNGAGESYTSENLCKAIINNACPVLYSSGTPIKGAKNLRVYSQLLPRGVNHEELLQVVLQDPISLQEALNHEIALSGSLISRELDNRAIVKDFAVSKDTERNRALSDQVSSILMAMSYVAGDVKNIVDERKHEIRKELKELSDDERVGSRMSVSSMNFGSRFHAISRQFLLAIKADQCVQEALEAIDRGEKPIVALQHTGESLLAAAIGEAKAAGSGRGGDLDDDAPVVISGEVVLPRPVSFRDLLVRYVERIQWIKETSHYGEVRLRKAASEEMKKAIESIQGMIDKLPDNLALTPIDYFKRRLEEHGYKVGEISGRSLAARYLDSGGVAIESVNNTDKSKVNKTSREFNNGELDALVLTASGSTGISLQAAPANGRDLRPRVMIKWEPQQDIAVERQMDGRHNRTGQVVAPRYRVLLSGLPADDRLAMMFNNKNRSLTSATVANRDSKELIRNVPDLLNEVGDSVAEDMFFANPSLAHLMDVELPDPDEKERFQKPENHYINRMTGRIMLLPYAEQVKLYEELGRRFDERLDELNARGENPLQVKCFEWKARVLQRNVFLGEEVEGGVKSQFEAPVYLTRVVFDREMRPLRSADVQRRIEIGRETMRAHPMIGVDGNARYLRDAIAEHGKRWLQESVSVYKFKSGDVSEALAAEEPNETKRLHEKLSWLAPRVEHVAPGNIFRVDLDTGEQVTYVVVGTELPKDDEAIKRLGEWGVYAVRPGYDSIENLSMNKLFTQKAMVTGAVFDSHPEARRLFDESPSGKVQVEERLLDGNIFEAVATGLRHKVGRKIVYTDEQGIRQHGVLIRHGVSLEKLKATIAERVRDGTEAVMVVDAMRAKGIAWSGLTSNQEGKFDDKDAIRLSRTDEGDYCITVPGTKAGGGHVFLDPRVAHIEGNAEAKRGLGLRFEGSRSSMRAYVKPRQVTEVLDFLMQEKNVWFYTVDKDMLRDVRAQVRSGAESANETVVVGR